MKYELAATSVSSTSIECILGGGKSGDYDVVVIVGTAGATVPDSNSVFKYKIFVESLSISTGHKGGGYDLTVTGRNFAPSKGSTNVFIGTAMNSIC